MSARTTVRKGKVAAKNRQRKDGWRNIRLFRWVKRSLSGKSHTQSADLLDQWILKKKMLSLFF